VSPLHYLIYARLQFPDFMRRRSLLKWTFRPLPATYGNANFPPSLERPFSFEQFFLNPPLCLDLPPRIPEFFFPLRNHSRDVILLFGVLSVLYAESP